MRVILGSSTVTLAGEVELTQGDVIRLYYEANGSTIPIYIGGNLPQPLPGSVWSINRLT